MTCQDCPDTPSDGVKYIVYGGGPPHAQYPLVRLVIDNTVLRQYQPVVHPDGRIEYTEGVDPPQIEGYEQSGNTLTPVWPSCSERMLRCTQRDNGSLCVEARCLNLASGNRASIVLKLDGCKACSVRQPIK